MIIDTHAHLTDSVFDADRHEIITGLAGNGIGAIINVGYDRSSSKFAIELADKYPIAYAAIGTHPHDADGYKESDGEFYLAAAAHPRVVAIGEIGLDYHYDNSPRDIQRSVFAAQIRIADKAKLPVILHTRDADEDTLRVLDDNRAYLNSGVLVHCFSGNRDFAKESVKRGFYMAFGGAITYKNNLTAPDVIAEVGLNNVVLETDCPYLTPVPHRGKVKYNQPKYIREVAGRLADWLDLSISEVERRTTENAYRFFRKMLRKEG